LLTDRVLVAVRRGDLWGVTSVVSAMQALFDLVVKRIHVVEAATAQQCYGR